MKISVIIPVYNGEQYIREAILSVLNQPYKNIEVICIDDGSKDNSYNIICNLSKCDKRIKVYKQENIGVCVTRNRGIEYSTGEYVTFLDQDDIWIEGVIDESTIQMIMENNADMISFEYRWANSNLTRYSKIEVPKEGIGNGGAECFGVNFRHHSSYFYKKSVLQKYMIQYSGGRHEDERFRPQALYYSREIYYLKKELFIYRNNPYSVTHTKIDVEKMLQGCINDWLILFYEKREEKEFANYCKNIINRLMLELRIACEEKYKSNKIAKNHYNIYVEQKGLNKIINREQIWMNKTENNDWIMEERYPYLFHLKYHYLKKVLNLLKRNNWIIKLYDFKRYPNRNVKEI